MSTLVGSYTTESLGIRSGAAMADVWHVSSVTRLPMRHARRRVRRLARVGGAGEVCVIGDVCPRRLGNATDGWFVGGRRRFLVPAAAQQRQRNPDRREAEMPVVHGFVSQRKDASREEVS